MSVSGTPIGQLLEQSYRQYSARTADISDDRSLSYAELRESAVSVAGALRERGVTAGDRLMLVGSNSAAWAVMNSAYYLAGFVRIAVSPRLHPRELALIAEDSGVSVIALDGDWLGEVGADWIPESVRTVIVLRGQHPLGIPLWELVDEEQTGEAMPAPDPSAPSWISYTSGTTGSPKGVVHTQLSIAAMIENTRLVMGGAPREGDITLHTGPLSHFSGVLLHTALIGGATNIIERGFDVSRTVAALCEHPVSILPLMPTQITMLTNALLTARETATRRARVGAVLRLRDRDGAAAQGDSGAGPEVHPVLRNDRSSDAAHLPAPRGSLRRRIGGDPLPRPTAFRGTRPPER